MAKLKHLRHALFDWNSAGTSNSARQLSDLETALRHSLAAPVVDWREVHRLKGERAHAQVREERYRRQQGRNNWLKEGHRNTTYFHRSVTATRKRKRIDILETEDGGLLQDEDLKGQHAVSFYQTLFATEHSSSYVDLSPLHLSSLLSDSMNSALLADVSEPEIKEAVFAIGPMQAPGPDGFTGLFFQRYWDIIHRDVELAVLEVFSTGRMLRSLNHTWLTLIPKTSDARSMRHLRPIGLCIVVYKIISKILSGRLGAILPSLVDPAQNGFVRNRLISDNILLAHELVHHLHVHTGQHHLMALKIDMEKAYDQVEWSFLFPLMQGLGFAPRWVALIRECLSSATISVLVNGRPYGFFSPTRGLRQGDPLSPLLFSLCSEGLSRLLRHAAASRTLCGIRINHRAPEISHLMFADDTILFLRVNRTAIGSILQLLSTYHRLSGQRVNLGKSSVLFSDNASAAARSDYMRRLGVVAFKPQDKYLGLPCIIMRSRQETFRFVEDHVSLRLRSWKRHCLSPAGVYTLIKSVISGLPVYAMSCYMLPDTLCQRLNSLLARFWWGQVGSDQKIHWVSWRRLSLPLSDGGLGFRDFALFNQALLAKQGWRLLTNPALLLTKVLKAKYFPFSNFLSAAGSSRPSYGWQSIVHGRSLLRLGIRWQIGTGHLIDPCLDAWLPGDAPSAPTLLPGHYHGPPTVVGFITNGTWCRSELVSAFTPASIERILSIPLPRSPQDDCLIWHYTASGHYVTSSGYELLAAARPNSSGTARASPISPQLWRSIWVAQVHPKLRFFL
ncbi:LINE-1 retrotransposable element ORF2 protein [Linum grandiflorum]